MIEEVILNDVVIHKNVEVKGPTGGSLRNREAPRGPLLFQGDHGPVAYRNIRVKPLDSLRLIDTTARQAMLTHSSRLF